MKELSVEVVHEVLPTQICLSSLVLGTSFDMSEFQRGK